MVEAVMIWNEPNNLSHWDFQVDRDWKIFAEMVLASAAAVRRANPEVKIALGGISPIDPNFIQPVFNFKLGRHVHILYPARHGPVYLPFLLGASYNISPKPESGDY